MFVGLSVAAILLGLVALVFAAYNVAMIRQMKGLAARVEDLEAAVNLLNSEEKEEEEEEEEEESAPEDAVPVEADPPEAEKPSGPPPPVWQEFVDSYNKLAETLAAGADDAGAAGFVKDKELSMLTCTGHSSDEEGKNMPNYMMEEGVAKSMYWAFSIPGRPLDYAIVPNPMHAYDETMHTENGMKETFASNYESGSMKHIRVKVPALFHKKGDAWEIAQPGVLQLSE